MIAINWATKVITIPKADLTLVSGALYELDVDWLRLQLKDIEDSDLGMAYPDTHRHNTTVTLSGVAYSRTFEVVNGFTVTFEDGQYSVRCINANHNLADVKNVNQVSLIIGNSAGLQIVTTGGTGGAGNVPILYAPTSATRVIGDNDGGTVANMSALDESSFITGEVSGTGLEVIVTLAASAIAENPSLVRIVGNYAGSAAHQVNIQTYDYVMNSWEDAGLMLSRASSFSYVIPLHSHSQHAGTGEMKLRFKHNVVGTYIVSHALNLDYISFEKVETADAMASDIAAIRNKTDQLQFVLNSVIATLEPTQATDIAAAVVAALNATTIPVDIAKVNGTTVTGSGTTIDPWGPA